MSEKQAEEAGSLDYESRMLLQFCRSEGRLLETYQALERLARQPPQYSQAVEGQEQLQQALGLPADELASLQTQLDVYHTTTDAKRKVHFDDDPTMTITDFLSCFECHIVREDKHAEGNKHQIPLTVIIKPSLPEPKYHRLGMYLNWLINISRPQCTD